MRNKGVLFYKLGSYFLIIFALIHTLSFFTNPADLMTNDEDKRVWQLVQTHVFNVGDFSTTIKSLFMGFSLYLEILTLFAGLLNILLIRQHATNATSLRLWAGVNVIMVGLLLIITAIFFHLPPLILFGLSWLFFLLALILPKN